MRDVEKSRFRFGNPELHLRLPLPRLTTPRWRQVRGRPRPSVLIGCQVAEARDLSERRSAARHIARPSALTTQISSILGVESAVHKLFLDRFVDGCRLTPRVSSAAVQARQKSALPGHSPRTSSPRGPDLRGHLCQTKTRHVDSRTHGTARACRNKSTCMPGQSLHSNGTRPKGRSEDGGRHPKSGPVDRTDACRIRTARREERPAVTASSTSIRLNKPWLSHEATVYHVQGEPGRPAALIGWCLVR